MRALFDLAATEGSTNCPALPLRAAPQPLVLCQLRVDWTQHFVLDVYACDLLCHRPALTVLKGAFGSALWLTKRADIPPSELAGSRHPSTRLCPSGTGTAPRRSGSVTAGSLSKGRRAR